MVRLFHIVVSFSLCLSTIAQFSPPAGQEGTTAIHKDSSVFIDWATSCNVERGYLDISVPDSGMVSAGEAVFAIGIADNLIVSLGDNGSAVLTFNKSIQNGPGPDFAVFENSFTDDFLELAFVEVSSNGIDFVRFPSVSLTQTEQQIGSFGLLDATKIHNLAGKYRVEYGTPFDLEELNNISGLNIDSITHVKIIDVVGCIQDEYSTYDSQGNKVNDPWPTLFPSGGFDLDAVGVIHNLFNQGIVEYKNSDFKVFPNPVVNRLTFESNEKYHIELLAIGGQVLFKGEISKGVINMRNYPQGIYFMKISNSKRNYTRKIIKL